MKPAEVFHRNLHSFAGARKISDAESLADTLGFRGEDRKWLQRIWRKGLVRPDTRTKKKLEQLSEFFQCEIAEFWNPETEVNPHRVSDSRETWAFFVKRVIDSYRFIQQAKLRRNKGVRDVLAKYGFHEELLIADWMASEFGAERPSFEDINAAEFYDAQDDFLSEWAFINHVMSGDETGNPLALFEFVGKRASEHPAWNSFTELLYEFFDKTYGAADESVAEAHVKDWIVQILDDLKRRPLSPQEILDLFIKFYLDGTSDEAQTVNDGIEQIVQEIQLHPQWAKFVEQKFGAGNFSEAENELRIMWSNAVMQLGHNTVTPDDFVSYFSRRLDDLSPVDVYEKETRKD